MQIYKHASMVPAFVSSSSPYWMVPPISLVQNRCRSGTPLATFPLGRCVPTWSTGSTSSERAPSSRHTSSYLHLRKATLSTSTSRNSAPGTSLCENLCCIPNPNHPPHEDNIPQLLCQCGTPPEAVSFGDNDTLDKLEKRVSDLQWKHQFLSFINNTYNVHGLDHSTLLLRRYQQVLVLPKRYECTLAWCWLCGKERCSNCNIKGHALYWAIAAKHLLTTCCKATLSE